ncbi:hypothetical protein L7F22_027435 [Adiantum nelumboides]|nr:hypothetical protein [Adiantum nelumboides]
MFVRDLDGPLLVPFYDRRASDIAANIDGYEADSDMLREPFQESSWTLDTNGAAFQSGGLLGHLQQWVMLYSIAWLGVGAWSQSTSGSTGTALALRKTWWCFDRYYLHNNVCPERWDFWLETAELVSFWFRIPVNLRTGSDSVDLFTGLVSLYSLVSFLVLVTGQYRFWSLVSSVHWSAFWFCTGSGLWLALFTGQLSGSGNWIVQVLEWLDNLWLAGSGLLVTVVWTGWLVTADSLVTGSGPSAGTQGSATQDPHIAASDSSSDFDVMEGYPMQQYPKSSSQDMHALGQQPGISMFSRLNETLSRATRSKHATNEINEGNGEVDSPFTSQIDPVLSESAHVNTPATTPIGLSKFTPSETLLPDGRSLAEVQEVERYILAAREKEIESLRKAEQCRATLAKAPMTSTNPLQSPELTTLKSQPIGSHIASGSKDTPNTAILDGVFLNENWEYNLQTEKLTDLYTSYTYHVGWLDVIQATSNSTSVDEQQRMICDVIHSIVQMERQNLGINMPSMCPMRFLDTTKAKQPTISQMETPSVSPMDPSYIVSPGVSMQSEPTHGSFSFPDLVQPSLGDLPTPTMNMTGSAPSTLLASTTPLHTSVAPMPIPIGAFSLLHFIITGWPPSVAYDGNPPALPPVALEVRPKSGYLRKLPPALGCPLVALGCSPTLLQ